MILICELMTLTNVVHNNQPQENPFWQKINPRRKGERSKIVDTTFSLQRPRPVHALRPHPLFVCCSATQYLAISVFYANCPLQTNFLWVATFGSNNLTSTLYMLSLLVNILNFSKDISVQFMVCWDDTILHSWFFYIQQF